jgi:hypothetical protein
MSLISKATSFARSPQGRKLVDEAKRLSKDPETRRKIDGVRAQLQKRRATR